MRTMARLLTITALLLGLALTGVSLTSPAAAAQPIHEASATATEAAPTSAAGTRKIFACQYDLPRCQRGRNTLVGLGYSTTPIYDGRGCTFCPGGYYFYYWK